MNQNAITCKNCGNNFTGNYCNVCGQRATTKRLNLKQILHDFFHAFTHVDKGFLYSAKELAIRPGHSIRGYIEGKRAAHASPFLMLIIIGGLCSVLYYNLEIKMLNSYTISELEGNLHIITSKFFALSMVAYCFAFSLVDYIVFYYKKYNYIELFVMNTFVAIEVLVLNILLIPLWLITSPSGTDDYIRPFLFIILIVYFIITRFQFFEARKDKKVYIRLILESFFFFGFLILIGWKNIIALFQTI